MQKVNKQRHLLPLKNIESFVRTKSKFTDLCQCNRSEWWKQNFCSQGLPAHNFSCPIYPASDRSTFNIIHQHSILQCAIAVTLDGNGMPLQEWWRNWPFQENGLPVGILTRCGNSVFYNVRLKGQGLHSQRIVTAWNQHLTYRFAWSS